MAACARVEDSLLFHPVPKVAPLESLPSSSSSALADVVVVVVLVVKYLDEDDDDDDDETNAEPPILPARSGPADVDAGDGILFEMDRPSSLLRHK